MPTLVEQWMEEGEVKGGVSEAGEVVIELLEERFGTVPSGLSEKLSRIQGVVKE